MELNYFGTIGPDKILDIHIGTPELYKKFIRSIKNTKPITTDDKRYQDKIIEDLNNIKNDMGRENTSKKNYNKYSNSDENTLKWGLVGICILCCLMETDNYLNGKPYPSDYEEIQKNLNNPDTLPTLKTCMDDGVLTIYPTLDTEILCKQYNKINVTDSINITRPKCFTPYTNQFEKTTYSFPKKAQYHGHTVEKLASHHIYVECFKVQVDAKKISETIEQYNKNNLENQIKTDRFRINICEEDGDFAARLTQYEHQNPDICNCKKIPENHFDIDKTVWSDDKCLTFGWAKGRNNQGYNIYDDNFTFKIIKAVNEKELNTLQGK